VAGVQDGEHADVDVAGQEEEQEGEGGPVAAGGGDVDRDREVEREAQLQDGHQVLLHAVRLLLPALVLVVRDAHLRGADEVGLVADEALEDRAGVVDRQADAQGHQERQPLHALPGAAVQRVVRDDVTPRR
jgi:hypothetical protein